MRTTKQKIVTHIAYRQIFNAPVRISDCKDWVGRESNEAFQIAIEELQKENLISVRDEFICLKGNESIIDAQAAKDEFTAELMSYGEKVFFNLSKLPFIRYIGISGSVAANNPTLQSNKRGKAFVDLDFFVITRSNSLWPLFLFERVLTNIERLFKGHHFYCFNYVTEESFLEVYNKNFYTATEINNLKTIYDDGIFFLSSMKMNGEKNIILKQKSPTFRR